MLVSGIFHVVPLNNCAAIICSGWSKYQSTSLPSRISRSFVNCFTCSILVFFRFSIVFQQLNLFNSIKNNNKEMKHTLAILFIIGNLLYASKSQDIIVNDVTESIPSGTTISDDPDTTTEIDTSTVTSPITSTPATIPTSTTLTTSTEITSTTNNSSSSTTPIPPTINPPTSPTTKAPHKNRHFDGPSFIGGIILATGLMAIGFVALKFYKARNERNYHTL